jgi:iron complex outermembrane receptor protein
VPTAILWPAHILYLETDLSHQLHPRSLACALLVLSYAAAPAALAQEATGGPGDAQPRQPGTKLERVEVSSRALSDTDLRRRAPVAKQIYGREELDKYGDSNVADVLKRLPGVSVQGNAPRMRGLGAGYTLILINGDPAPPGFQLDQLDPKQVERIEVTKGPTADQSAQAVAGAINIILKDAPRVSQRDLGVRLGYNADRPVGGLNFTWGERVLGGMAVSVPVSLFTWRGRNEIRTEKLAPGSNALPAASVQSATQPFWGHGFNASPRLNWKISDDESLTLQSFFQDGRWNNKTSFSNEVLSGRPLLEDDNLGKGSWRMARGNVQYANRLNENQRLELKAGVQESKGGFDVQTYRDGAVRRRSFGDNKDSNITQGGKFSQLIGDSHSLTVGWDLEWRRRDEMRETTELGVPQLPEFDGQPFGARIERQALFVQDEWELSPQWSTYLGLRGERIVTESRGLSETLRNTSQVVTPLWHLNYKLDPKGRDLIRGSLTRSYKAPDLNALLSRPGLNGLYPDASKPNSQIAPDRAGNPLLKPELATGLDLAFEKYMAGGGMFSIGVFHRQVTDLIRNQITLETVPWSGVQRWVSRPTNFSKATTSGLELELKGRAGELLPSVFDPKLALNLRSSLNIYRSRVQALEGPNNRLDGQQPWSANLGFDYRLSSLPMPVVTGASFAYTPGYTTRQLSSQWLEQSHARGIDLFAQFILSRQTSVRVMANNFAPVDNQSRTLLDGGYYTEVQRKGRTWWGVMLEHKL